MAPLIPLTRPSAGSHLLAPATMEWQPTDTPGFWLKPLLADDASGGTTSLMLIDPGAFAESHFHDQLEEILVLDGPFDDEENSYGPGDYCVRAPGAAHTAGSVDGCTVLLIYRD